MLTSYKPVVLVADLFGVKGFGIIAAAIQA